MRRLLQLKTMASLAAAGLLLALVSSSLSRIGNRPRHPARALPPIILWAWERPENLEFLDPQQFGVAFLAQTLSLKGDEVVLTPRHQELKVSPATKLVAVTRIESQKSTGGKATLSRAQIEKLVSLIARTQNLHNVSAIQVDFDAVVSEREFYRALLEELRQRLPERLGLSMTALASFCIGDRWLDELPVDEAVPMIFGMGPDGGRVKSFLSQGNDFHQPLCQRSYGVALDEPLEMKFDSSRRLYIFNTRAWTASDVQLIEEMWR
jgi:Protein of unknown function (DUF3142)